MLFTDLSNPTSNKIYAEVGFRRVGDWEEHSFQSV
jgi:predicted GNAT family acetyltransferase